MPQARLASADAGAAVATSNSVVGAFAGDRLLDVAERQTEEVAQARLDRFARAQRRHARRARGRRRAGRPRRRPRPAAGSAPGGRGSGPDRRRARRATSISASVARASNCSSRPSSGRKPGTSPASAGKAGEQALREGVDGLDAQAAAGRRRARGRRGCAPCRRLSGRNPRRAPSVRRRASLCFSRTQRASRAWMRSAISAAPALVKVRQRIEAGSTPESSSRSTRAVSTWVLPVPAEAESAAWPPGREASSCAPFQLLQRLQAMAHRLLSPSAGPGARRPVTPGRSATERQKMIAPATKPMIATTQSRTSRLRMMSILASIACVLVI